MNFGLILAAIGFIVVGYAFLLELFGSQRRGGMLRWGFAAVGVGVVIMLSPGGSGGAVSGSPQPPTTPVVNPTPQQQPNMIQVTASSSIEEKLAALERNSQTLPREAIPPYRIGLDRLVPKCTESRDHIGDMALVGQRSIKERIGLDVSILTFLDEMNEAIPEGIQMECASVAAALVATWQ